MQVLREISKVSIYRPLKGLKNELFKLVKDDHITRDQAVTRFEEINKKDQFYEVYKRLKYSLLDGILNKNNINIPKSYLPKIDLWKRNLQIRILFITGNLKAAVKVAAQTILIAEKNNEIEVVISLSKELKRHYSINEPNYLKFHKYEEKFITSTKILVDQIKVESVYQELVLCIKTKRSFDHIEREIKKIDLLSNGNDYHLFRYHLYKLKSLFYRTVNDELEFIANNEKAIDFFSNQDVKLPYQTKLAFLIELVPYYIIKGQFAKAGNLLNICLELPPMGSFNWHLVLIYQSYLGFYSGKPMIAEKAFRTANNAPKRLKNTVINEKWYLIKGYLAFYKQTGKVSNDRPFRLSSYLNRKENRGENKQKSNLIIIELLHLLQQEKHLQFLEKSDRLESFISTRFKAHQFYRTRYFLRMMKMIVKGNYHPNLVQKHAQKNLKKLENSTSKLNANSLDIELVPYELLWNEILKIISKN